MQKCQRVSYFPANITGNNQGIFVSEQELNRVYLLRNFLSDMPSAEAIEFLMDRMKRTKTNQEFMDSMAQGA